DEQGRVARTPWTSAHQVLPQIQALILSEEDIDGDAGQVQRLAAQVPLLALTRGAQGVTLVQGGRAHHLPDRPAWEADPTGAGDVWAAAFLIRLAEGADAIAAARFANAVASFSVEGPGAGAIPTRAAVEGWLAAHPTWGWPAEGGIERGA
ncbi:MAG: carbohydrate kinase family protein, partial [Chloroflexi bacterium]|nr:carbohydrate kinase family protein [Chloroflexota bacterium]